MAVSETILQTNDTGEVLTTSTGEVLEENFEFGNCFKSDGLAYLRTKDNLGITNQSTFAMSLFFTNGVSAGLNSGTSLKSPLLNIWGTEGYAITYLYDGNYNTGIAIQPNNTYVGGPGAIGAVFNHSDSFKAGRNFFCLEQNASTIKCTYNKYSASVSIGSADVVTFDYFEFGYIYVYADLVPRGHSACIIYDRELLMGELDYTYNNLSGHQPFTLFGVKAYYLFQKAELLDFSTGQDGSDMRVGVRDFSGNNNHLFFTGLGAGTNASKLAYANANLFIPYSAS